jgi:mannose-1-phosphate guanylyltransferase
LCGGAGTRLWPLSREAFPKQFHRLTGPETLFQQTRRRLYGAPAKPIVLEPAGRNTAPAACVAALIAAEQDGEALAPADQHDRR